MAEPNPDDPLMADIVSSDFFFFKEMNKLVRHLPEQSSHRGPRPRFLCVPVLLAVSCGCFGVSVKRVQAEQTCLCRKGQGMDREIRDGQGTKNVRFQNYQYLQRTKSSPKSVHTLCLRVKIQDVRAHIRIGKQKFKIASWAGCKVA